MKKFMALFLITVLSSVSIVNAQTKGSSVSGKKVIVVYYSHTGNTKDIADFVKDSANADIFEIEPVNAYPNDHNVLVKQAKKEIDDGYLPPIKSVISNIEEYDVIFVGSPSWWSTIAPPVATFLSKHDLSGKTIIPFVTHEGSYIGNNAKDTARLAPNATVTGAKAFRGKNVKNAQKEVQEWIRDLTF